MGKDIFLSIVVPLYNEEKRLTKGFHEIYSYLMNKPCTWEVILVDDGSQDRTYEMMLELEKRYQGVRTFTNKKNLGKGAAVRNGMLQARGEIILFTDIDLSVPIHYVDAFISKLSEGFDIAIGTRRAGDSIIERHQPWLREFMGRVYTALSNLILGIDFKDHTCGMKGFKKEACHALFKRQVLNRWAFDSEILFLSKRLGFRIAEVPVLWRDMPGTKVRRLKDAINSLLEIIRIRLLHRDKEGV